MSTYEIEWHHTERGTFTVEAGSHEEAEEMGRNVMDMAPPPPARSDFDMTVTKLK